MIKYEKPPKWIADECFKRFGASWYTGTVFAVRDSIYTKDPISNDLLAHERVHLKQQKDNWVEWWKKYLNNPQFRLSQEIPAYQAQYREFCRTNQNETERNDFLKFLSETLSGYRYGNLISTGYAQNSILDI